MAVHGQHRITLEFGKGTDRCFGVETAFGRSPVEEDTTALAHPQVAPGQVERALRASSQRRLLPVASSVWITHQRGHAEVLPVSRVTEGNAPDTPTLLLPGDGHSPVGATRDGRRTARFNIETASHHYGQREGDTTVGRTGIEDGRAAFALVRPGDVQRIVRANSDGRAAARTPGGRQPCADDRGGRWRWWRLGLAQGDERCAAATAAEQVAHQPATAFVGYNGAAIR